MSKTQRLKVRISRIERRSARIERRLANLAKWQENKHGPVRVILREILDEDPDASDEDLVEALKERLDDLIPLSGVYELISDLGLEAFAALAVWILRNRAAIMRQRLARLQSKLEELRERLSEVGPDDLLGDRDSEDVLRALGIDEQFFTAADAHA